MIGKIAFTGAVIAEVLAFYVINAWFGAGYDEDRHAVHLVTFLVVGAVGYSLRPSLDQFEISERTRSVLAAGATFLVIILAIRIEYAGDIAIWNLAWLWDLLVDSESTLERGADALLGFLFLFGLWVRMVIRSEQEVDLEAVPRSIVPPFLIVTIALLFGSFTDAAGTVGRTAAAVYAIAITSMAMSQLARSGATIGTVRAGGITATLLGGTAVAALAGLGITALLWGPVAEPIARAIGAGVEAVLIVVLTPPLWLLEQFFRFLFGGGIQLPEPSEFVENTIGEDSEATDQPNDSGAGFVAAFALRLLAVGIVGAVVAAVVIYFIRGRRRRASQELAGPEYAQAGGIGDDIRGLFGMFRRPRRRTSVIDGDNPAVRLYLSVLQAADHDGHPRPDAATPKEFAPELIDTYHNPATDEITQAFNEARYAGRSPDPRIVDELERRWRLSRQASGEPPPASEP